jgi:hypothetical protein
MEAKTTTFTDCALYITSSIIGNVIRFDVRLAKITTGQQYAQYNNAIKVEYLEKRARKSRGLYLTYKPFLVVLSAKDAIVPNSMMDPDTSSEQNGVTLLKSRYSSFDSRWKSDFTATLAAQNIQPLFQVGNDYNTHDNSKETAA